MKKGLFFIVALLFTLTGCFSLSANTTLKTNEKGTYLPATTLTFNNSNVIDLQNQIEQVSAYMGKATLAILNYQTTVVNNESAQRLVSFGSGVIYKKTYNAINNTYTYYAFTNKHVVQKGERFEIYDGEDKIAADLVGTSSEYDVAIVRFTTSASDYVSVNLVTQSTLKKGQFVIAMGTPKSLDYYNTVTVGVISNFFEEKIQHDAAINSGNSGGPLFDIYGNLVGINTSKLSSESEDVDVDGIGFAIGTDALIEAQIEIEQNDPGFVLTPIIGISVLTISTINEVASMTLEEAVLGGLLESDYNRYLEYASKNLMGLANGVLITEVKEDGAGYNAGLQAYDIITFFDETEIISSSDISTCLRTVGVGGVIQVTVVRGTETVVLTLNI